MSEWDEDDDFEDDRRPPVRRGRTPTGRVYVHRGCGGQTRASGGDYTHICDPFWPCTGTYCCGCRTFVPLSQVRWVDTGEPVSAYRRRVRAETPVLLQAWRYRLALLPGGGVGAVVGLVFSLAAGFNPQGLAIVALVGALVGALIVYFAGTFILNRIFDVDYRRMV